MHEYKQQNYEHEKNVGIYPAFYGLFTGKSWLTGGFG